MASIVPTAIIIGFMMASRRVSIWAGLIVVGEEEGGEDTVAGAVDVVVVVFLVVVVDVVVPMVEEAGMSMKFGRCCWNRPSLWTRRSGMPPWRNCDPPNEFSLIGKAKKRESFMLKCYSHYKNEVHLPMVPWPMVFGGAGP